MPSRIEILQRKEVFRRFVFRLDELVLRHELRNGGMSEPLTRIVFERGDSVALLLRDTAEEAVLLCEQFRVGSCEKGPGWLIELPAGVLESGEDPEECARREAAEETGYRVGALRHIGLFYLSPGGSSERIHVFFGDVTAEDRIGDGGGLEEEGEDIRIIRVPIAEALAKARDGAILDAKTMIALQWLEIEMLRA